MISPAPDLPDGLDCALLIMHDTMLFRRCYIESAERFPYLLPHDAFDDLRWQLRIYIGSATFKYFCEDDTDSYFGNLSRE